jgi:TonB family protein
VVRKLTTEFATVTALTLIFLPTSWVFPQEIQRAYPEQTPLTRSNGNATVATQARTHQPEDGSVSGNVYTNDFFEFTFEFPRGWFVETVGAANKGRPGENGIFDPQVIGTHTLLKLFQHPIGASVPVNPEILVLVNDVSCSPELETGEKVLLGLKVEFARRYSNFRVIHEPKNVTLGGKGFSRMDTSIDSHDGISLYQSYVSTVLNGYALIFALDAGRPEGLDNLVQTLNTLHFKLHLTPPSQESGSKGQSWEILTPTMGVDFRPYVNRFLPAVKRNWYALMPEEALQGRKGIVVVRFHIQQDGKIPPNEPWIERTSGSDPLDRAAAAAIRNSSPLEQLPAGYHGLNIELRFAVFYNLPMPCR